ncbi:MAG TPA: GNAT family N-acetyltransferase [Ktedonobacterales bacterium]|nr:GNAT family N-acetyltransferase [Ktedonobacterales bacterium]
MTTDIHAHYTVRQTTDKAEIAAFLNRDRLYAGYALCDLEDEYFASCQWFLTVDDQGAARGLAMVFGRLDPVVLFVMGEPEAVRTTLENDLTPAYIQLTAQPEHLPKLEPRYHLRHVREMLRMTVRKADFQTAREQERAERLTVADLDELNRIYRMAAASAFAAYQLEGGIFYGIKENGRLVATAGTHVISPTQRIVAVGNVFTHPHFRGRGYAQAVTGAVTAEALRGFGPDEPGQPEALAILNVRADNAPAIRAYKKIGYTEASHFVEAHGSRRWVSRLWIKG